MRTFEEIYQLVDQCSHETAYPKEECKALFDLLLELPDKANIVEVGVQFGRSATVIAEVGLEKKFNFSGVDNWSEGNSAEAKAHVESRIRKLGWSLILVNGDSVEFSHLVLDAEIDLIHIDGDHHYQPLFNDCVAWADKVKPGGYMLFDDYGHPGLEEVELAVKEYFATRDDFEFLGIRGRKLGVYRRLNAI